REETDVEELLDTVDKTLDRLKTLYEQYFLGIQKQAPTFIHNDIERKLRDLAQMQLRNTGLRYRLATLQQKFGSYNSYWRRTLREIENGTYARQLSKVGRDAIRSGADIPQEILARMPKRMRDQVVRDREQALAIARRHQQVEQAAAGDEQAPPEADGDFIAMIKEPTEVRRKLKSTDGAHMLSSDDDFDIDAFFAEVEQRDDKPAAARTATPPRGRGATRQPANRGRNTSAPPSYDDPDRPRPVTRNDLKRAATEPATPLARAVERTGSSPVIKRPGSQAEPAAPPPVPGRAGPPPIPGRTTGAIPTIKRPDTNLDSEEPTTPNAFPAGRPSGAMPALDRRTGRPVERGPVDRSGVPAPLAGEPTGRAKTQTGSTMASQMSRPNPIAPGSAAARGPVQVESMSGPFPRNATPAKGVPTVPKPAVQTGVVPVIPQTGAVPRIPGSSATPIAGMPAIPRPGTGAQPAISRPATGPSATAQPAIPRPGTGAQPAIPRPGTGAQPAIPRPGSGPSATVAGPSSDMTGPHQPIARPTVATNETQALPTMVRPPASSRTTPAAGVPAIARADVIVTRTPGTGMPARDVRTPHAGVPASARTPAAGVPIKPGTGARPPAAAPQKTPPGMTDADVNALYAKYVKAKEMVGEKIGPGEHNKLLKTINAQAPKIMEQYKAKGVDFSVVVKDNQVIIRAKPKT
ncbi:MAG TPA: MXAN_5187 C-terminal domain-containing protein, partial [Kofleriaceae bacterium]|nr:MXAN_5187 C-terminal domain-containing protein [Kofleriaceae bacterium]